MNLYLPKHCDVLIANLFFMIDKAKQKTTNNVANALSSILYLVCKYRFILTSSDFGAGPGTLDSSAFALSSAGIELSTHPTFSCESSLVSTC